MSWARGDVINTQARLRRLSSATPSSYTVFDIGGTIYAETNKAGGTNYEGADATTVINQALAALTGGRTWQEKVTLKGDFSLSDHLVISSYSQLDVQGRLFLANGANTPLIENEHWGAAPQDHNIDIFGGVWDGNRTNQVIVAHHGISLRSVYDVRVLNTHIKSMEGYYGIYVAPFGVQEDVRAVIANNFVEDVEDTTNGYGIWVTGAGYDSSINNNIIWDSRGGIIIEDNVEGVSVTGNNIHDLTGSHGISIATSTDLIIANNFVRNVTGNGRGITTDIPANPITHDIIFANNFVDLTGYHGIYVTAENCIVTGNLCRNANQVGAVGAHVSGIGTSAEADYSIIMGNRCLDDQGAPTQDEGIVCAADYVTITGNNCQGNKTSPYYILGGTNNTYDAKIVSDAVQINGATTTGVMSFKQPAWLARAYLLYETGVANDTNVEVGYGDVAGVNRDKYVASVTSGTGAIWETEALTLVGTNDIGALDTVTLYQDGSGGAGEYIRLVLDVLYGA